MTFRSNLIKELETLRTGYDQLEQIIPFENLRDSDIAIHPRSSQILDLLEKIFKSMGRLSILKKDFALDNFGATRLPNDIKWFLDNEIESKFEVIGKLLNAYHPDAWLLVFLDPSNRLGHPENDSTIRDTFRAALECLDDTIEEDDDRRFEDFDFDGSKQIVESSLFAPDTWKVNIESLKPIFLKESDVIIPKNIRIRLESVYKAFIFENWMASISMSRSTLEYALRYLIKTDARYSESKKDSKLDLSDMIDIATPNKLDELYESMDHIRTRGNAVLHLTSEPSLNSPGREISLGVILKLQHSIQSLFEKY